MFIILFGHKYCGKSHFANLLSDQTSYNCVETDKLIEELFYQIYEVKLSFREIYENFGDVFFRDLEKTVITKLVYEPRTIVSVGGGALLNEDNLKHLSQLGFFVYLKCNKELLMQRALVDPAAYFDESNFVESFENIFLEREQHFHSIPSVHVEIDNKTDEEVVENIKLEIKKLSVENAYGI